MSLEFARGKVKEIVSDSVSGIVTDSGKLLLNALYPNDFEYYLMGFEVIDGADIVTDRFVLPVLPQNITINNQKIKTVQKTGGGITVFQNNTFEPVPIVIQGTFGRSMKLMIGNFFSDGGKLGSPSNPNHLFKDIKTGYGALKDLEAIYNKDGQVDDNNIPFRINFYNMAFNQNVIVEMTNFVIRQDEGNNMIWYYTLSMTAVASSDTKGFEFNQARFASLGVINKALNDLVRDARTLIN